MVSHVTGTTAITESKESKTAEIAQRIASITRNMLANSTCKGQGSHCLMNAFSTVFSSSSWRVWEHTPPANLKVGTSNWLKMTFLLENSIEI